MDAHHTKKAIINKQINNAQNLVILHAAVAEKIGTVLFRHDQIENPNSSENLINVRSISIDSLTKKFGTPALVFIDIEGYEYNALKGSKNTLKLATDWCIEFHVKCGLEKFSGSVEKILSYFPQSRYCLYMAPATDKCNFVPFKSKDKLVKTRFYLIAISRLLH